MTVPPGTRDASPPSARLGGQILRVTGTALGARILTAVMGFATIPLLIRALGRDHYGVYATVVSSAVFLIFADQGLAVATRTRVAQAAAGGSLTQVGDVVRASAKMMLIVVAGLGVLILLVALGLPWTSVVGPQAQLGALLYLGLTTCLLLASVPMRSLEGIGRSATVAAMPVLGSAWLLGTTIMCLYLDLGLTSLLVAAGCLNLMPAVVCWWLLSRELSGVKSERPQRRIRIRELWGGSWPMAVVSIMLTISYSIDPLVISAVLHPSDTADYAVAAKIYQLALIVLLASVPVLWTHFAGRRAQGGFDIHELLQRTVIMAAGALALASCLCLAGPRAIALWVGPSFSGAEPILFAFAVLVVITSLQVVPGAALTDDASLRYQVVTTTLMAVANVPTSIYLARTIGPEGPVWASASCLLVFHAAPLWYRAFAMDRATVR